MGQTTVLETYCDECGAQTMNGVCVDVECIAAREEATRDGARSTAKATASATREQPSAWTSAGRVD